MTFWEIRQGDALEQLRRIEDETVQCCITSPPYWSLRDYGTATWVGGDPACSHKGRQKPRQDTTGSGINKGRFAESRGTQPGKTAYSVPVRGVCRCGAERRDLQLGLEASAEEYVERLVEVMAEVRRVLKADGTLWLNLGDCYASDAFGGSIARSGLAGGNKNHVASRAARTDPRRPFGLKPKQLVGIPWRVAFALQADGWWLRSDIIWSKTNAMPESVRDRPTKSHEYLFLLAKNERYYYDAAAIAEEASGRAPGNVTHKGADAYAAGAEFHRTKSGLVAIGAREVRNKRSVWTVATHPFPEAHFATFPPALVEPCILAGSRPGDLVLDPFAGAGTVGLVALRHGRRFLGIELNPEYVEMARRRIVGDAPLWNTPDEPQEAAR